MKKYIGLIIGLLPLMASAQIVMTGSYYMVMTGGSSANPTSLVLTNPAPSGITNSGTGWIISENEFNMVDWHIGTNTGNYTVPFGYSNAQYLPVTLDIGTAGVGSGVVKFSTYHAVADNWTGTVSLTGPQSDVTNMNAFILPGSPSNADNSYNIADRAYVIDANTGYTTKPAAGNITFSYISGTGNSEVGAPNVLNETHLMAERFNSGTNTWSDWFGYGCTQAKVGNVGTVQTGPVPAVDMYRSWALWDNKTPLPLTVTSTNILCGGNSTGSASVTVYGGVSAYTYSWNPGGQTSSTASGLSAGSYTVTVTDSHGCLSTISVTLTAPPAVTATATVTANATGCAANGSASVTAGGGTNPYTYSWTNGSTSTNATGLSAGSYTVTVHDHNGCTATASVTITAPAVVNANATVTANATGCLSNGSALSSPTGGASPYTYLWSNASSATTAAVSGLSAGTYTVTVHDNNGCAATGSVTITAPPQLAANATVTTNASGCLSNGSATSAPSGGNSPYTYLWSNASSATTAVVTGLSAGTYTVTVHDNNGCTATGSVTITAPPQLAANATVTANATGCLSNGSAVSAPSGGTSPYTYLWSNASSATTAAVSGLSAGTYTVTVHDKNGCTATGSITITAPPQLAANAIVTNNATGCLSNGSGSSSPTGGTPAYTYAWSNGATTSSISGLSAGTYTLTVTDHGGCTATGSITITAPAVVLANASVTANATGCLSNGSALSSPSGGNSPYTYLWSNASSATTAAVSGLSAGTYTVTVHDNNGCAGTGSVTITAPPQLAANATVTSNASGCLANGVATSAPSGGNAPYTYLWSNASSATTAVVTGLSAGTYTVTVHDINGCSATGSVTITAPPQLAANATVTSNATGCLSNGSASSSPTGGNSPYTYSWSNAATTSSISSLSAGTYTLTVTDNGGCTATGSVTITAPPQLAANATVTSNATGCLSNGSASSSPTGGNSPYTYSWSNAATTSSISALSAGTYTLTVTDNGGCTATGSVTITAPPQLAANATVTANASACSSIGIATSAPSGGSSPYTYSWTGGKTTATISSLSAGTYTLTVTDNSGCTATASVTITAPIAVTASATVTANTTECALIGSASVTPGGGTSPYTYLWNGGKTTTSISGLSAGTYTVTVTDKNGCVATSGVTITAPASLLLTPGTIMNTDSGGLCNGKAWLTVSGGTSAYTYSWSPGGQTTDTIKGQCNGTYCCTVTDANGCSSSNCITVTAVENISNASSIKIYPSPNLGNFTVSGVLRGQIIELYNYLGQKITSVVANKEVMQFDISTKANGVYLVRIRNADGTMVLQTKIVKTQ